MNTKSCNEDLGGRFPIFAGTIEPSNNGSGALTFIIFNAVMVRSILGWELRVRNCRQK